MFECFTSNAVNCQNKEDEILSQQTSNWKHKEEKRRVGVVDPADALSVPWFVTLQKGWHWKSVNKIGQQDDDKWDPPGVVGVQF